MSDKESNGEGATAAAGGEAMAVGCSPASLSSPTSSSNGGNGDAASASGGFEPNCSLDRLMEDLEALSPDGQMLHLDKRQVRWGVSTSCAGDATRCVGLLLGVSFLNETRLYSAPLGSGPDPET